MLAEHHTELPYIPKDQPLVNMRDVKLSGFALQTINDAGS